MSVVTRRTNASSQQLRRTTVDRTSARQHLPVAHITQGFINIQNFRIFSEFYQSFFTPRSISVGSSSGTGSTSVRQALVLHRTRIVQHSALLQQRRFSRDRQALIPRFVDVRSTTHVVSSIHNGKDAQG